MWRDSTAVSTLGDDLTLIVSISLRKYDISGWFVGFSG